MNITWPDGHQFAFTVVDDTDFATLRNVKPVYDLLADLGIKTTKTVWMTPGHGVAANGGSTCEDRDYLDWLFSLRRRGFEIALHNAAPCTSPREMTRDALARFQELFGRDQILFCNHTHCRENIYWGDQRLSGWQRSVYNLATRGQRRNISLGHVDGDPLFWGDLCRQHVRYVRNFVFDDLNALAVCPEQPYHDPNRPYVNFWFTSADGANLKSFCRNFTEEKLDLLAAAGGLCIAYVHFAVGFAENGSVNPEFRKRLEHLASLNGWFVPASLVLDHLRRGAAPGERVISPQRLHKLQTRWLVEKLFKGTT